MNNDRNRGLADRLRAVPLKDVLLAAGAEPDRNDRTKWRASVGVLSVNGRKFFNWDRRVGGGGAIDLAMHLNSLSFRDALAWLRVRHRSSSGASLADEPPRSTPGLPVPVERNLKTVERYLCARRLLPRASVRALIDAERIYADARANAVFTLLGKGNAPVGAELRGTGSLSWRGMAPGSRKDSGHFSVGPSSNAGVVLCESAIDAVSCQTLHPDRLCVSTSGARPNPAWLADLLRLGAPVHCGFDADGDRMARAMIALHPSVRRLRPPLHDWNDCLRAGR